MQNTKRRRLLPAWWLGLALIAVGCSQEVQQSLAPTPTAYGRINQVTVVADSSVWNGPIGDSLRYYYSSAFLILPQPEPIFDLEYLHPAELASFPVKQELRTYLIVGDLSEVNSPTNAMIRQDVGDEKIAQTRQQPGFGSLVGRDKWASGQLLIYLYAFNANDLIKHLIASYPAVAERIHAADAPRIDATVYFQGQNKGLEDALRRDFQVEMRIPKGYVKAISEPNFMWMRLETPDLSSNIMVYRTPYVSQSQLTREGLKAIRDSLGRQYVSSTLPNTYMRINDIDLPLFVDQLTLNGNYALEAHGIWEIENDFMGGAFVSYLVHDPEKKDLLFLDGFVHAPGKDKRDFVQHLEHIMRTVKY